MNEKIWRDNFFSNSGGLNSFFKFFRKVTISIIFKNEQRMSIFVDRILNRITNRTAYILVDIRYGKNTQRTNIFVGPIFLDFISFLKCCEFALFCLKYGCYSLLYNIFFFHNFRLLTIFYVYVR